MAKIHNFSGTGAGATDALLLFNRAMDLVFRPRPAVDPALAVCRTLSRIISLSGDNPHYFAAAEFDRLKKLAQA